MAGNQYFDPMRKSVFVLFLMSFAAHGVEIALSKNSNGLYSTECQAHQKKWSCVLDTGALYHFVNYDQDWSQHLKSSNFKDVVDIHGHKMATTMLHVEDLRVGGVHVGQSQVVMAKSQRPNSLQYLGLNLFDNKFLKLNFKKRSMAVSDQNFQKLKERFYYNNGSYIVLPIKLEALSGSALFDSAATISVIDLDWMVRSKIKSQLVGFANLSGFSGFNKKNPVFNIPRLRVGQEVFKNVHAVGLDLQKLNSKFKNDIQFIIGLNVMELANWSFDFKKDSWQVDLNN